MGKGQAAWRWLLSGLLAFSMLGFVGVGYAEPSAAADEPSGAAVEDADEVVVVEPEDSAEPDGSDALGEPNAQVDAPDAADGESASPDAEALAQAPALFSLEAPANDAVAADAASYAQPGPDDFDFSGGAIKQLKQTYVNGLTAEQKQDVRLVIPAEIRGVPVTEIASMAFYSYNSVNSGLVFTELDLSQATSLHTIGANAFRYASRLSGDLVIPDSVATIGESAFANCGYTGTLHLPRNGAFTTIPGQAFLNTKFTGTLEIPASVTVIGRKSFEGTCFSGELDIPEGVATMYASAFASCAYLTSVRIPSTMDFAVSGSDSGHHFQECSSLAKVEFAPNSSMTTLYSQDFYGCSKLKVLSLPDSIVSIDAKALNNCGLQTVYLPASATISANKTSFLTNCSNAVAVCKDKASYDSYKAQFATAQQKYLSYPVTVSFNAGSYGTNPPAVTRLFDRPLNMVQDEATQVWAVDSAYALPVPGGVAQPPTGAWFAWSFDAAGSKPATGTTSTGTAGDVVLHAQGVKLADPTFSYRDIYKTYDGETSYLEVEASHPLAKDPAEAQVGDYAFYYAWVHWNNGASNIVKQGFSNKIGFSEVGESTTGQNEFYSVQSYLYQLTESGWKKVLGSYTQFYLRVQIQPAASSVHPVVAAGESNLEGLPALSVSDGDTPGVVTWADGQTLQEGTHSYTWTFTPDAPAAGKPANYKSDTGTMDLRVVDGRAVQRVTFDTGDGSALDPIDVPCATALPGGGMVPVREGHVFCGWYRDAAFTQPWAASDPVMEDMTLHARWQQRTVSVDPGEGGLVVNGEPIDQQAHAVDVVRTPEVAPEEQETLKNAELLPEGSEPSSFFELELVVDGTAVERAEFGGGLSVTVSHPVKENVLYRDMHMKHDGALELLDADSSVEDQTLTFAVMSLSPFMVVEHPLCRVTFDVAGGSAVASLDKVPRGTQIAAPASPTRQGFEFKGWYRDAAGTTPWDFAQDAVTDDTTLHAVWSAQQNQGGTAPNPDGTGPASPSVDDPDGDAGDSPASDPNARGRADADGSGSPSPSDALASGTGDTALALPLMGLAAGASALALAMHRMRRRMR